MLEVDGKAVGCTTATCTTGCVVSMRSEVSTQAVKHKDVESENVREDFEPFVLEGLVSLDSDKVDPQPIKIMRDTCCAQSMILEDSLSFGEASVTGENVLIQGIGMDIISVPLHRINLKSDLISGTFIVGVWPELPVKGVYMLLGNDLAGGKVLPKPIILLTVTPARKLIMMMKVVSSFQLVQ